MTSTSDEELVASSALPVNDPLLRAYHAYRETRDYKNTRKWALTDEHVDGSLWAAFMHGWEANDAATSSSHDSLVKALEEIVRESEMGEQSDWASNAEGRMLRIARAALSQAKGGK